MRFLVIALILVLTGCMPKAPPTTTPMPEQASLRPIRTPTPEPTPQVWELTPQVRNREDRNRMVLVAQDGDWLWYKDRKSQECFLVYFKGNNIDRGSMPLERVDPKSCD